MIARRRSCWGSARIGSLATVVAALVFIGSHASAQSGQVDALRRADYSIFSGDINQDGISDFLVKAKERFAIIDIDVIIPIPIRPTSPTFVLLSAGGGSYTLDAAPSRATIRSSVWQAASHQMVFGDFTGTGVEGFLLRSVSTGGTSFTVTMESSGLPRLLQSISATSLGVDLGGPNSASELRDVNGDGRADLVVLSSGRVADAFLANPDGTYARSQLGSIHATWLGLLTSLDNQNVLNAIHYIAADSQPRYQQILEAMGNTMTTVRSSLSNFAAIEVTPSYARFVVDQAVDGHVRSHFVSFIFTNGRWVLASF